MPCVKIVTDTTLRHQSCRSVTNTEHYVQGCDIFRDDYAQRQFLPITVGDGVVRKGCSFNRCNISRATMRIFSDIYHHQIAYCSQ